MPASPFSTDLHSGLEVCRVQSLQFALCDAITNVSLSGMDLHSDLIFFYLGTTHAPVMLISSRLGPGAGAHEPLIRCFVTSNP